MAKTHCTNPHSEEPTRRSNRTAGKSHASFELPARKKVLTIEEIVISNDDWADGYEAPL